MRGLLIGSERCFRYPIAAVVFTLFLVMLPLIPSILPTAYALGCTPAIGEFKSEGPYPLSLQGFAGIGSTVVDGRMVNVLTVTPASNSSFKYAYSQDSPEQWGFAIRLVVMSAPAWLNASFEPSSVVFQPKEPVNVTVTFHINKDAPPGDYSLMLAGEYGDQFDITYCPYAPLNVILRVSPEKPATVTTTQVVLTTATSTITKTSTETFTEASTVTSIERNTDPSTYAWALSATGAAMVLALVLLLQRRSR